MAWIAFMARRVYRQHPVVPDRRYCVGVVLARSVDNRSEASAGCRGGAGDDLPARADLRCKALETVHAQGTAGYCCSLVLRLDFLGIDDLLNDGQIRRPSLPATGAPPGSCFMPRESLLGEEASTFPDSFSGAIKKRSSWLASSFWLERPNTRRMSKVHLLAKQFDFLMQTGVLFSQLMIFFRKLLFAQSLHCFDKEAGCMPKYKQSSVLYALVALIPGRILAPRKSTPSISIERASALNGSLPPIASSGFGQAKVPFLEAHAQHPKPASIKIQDLEPSAAPVAKSKKRSAFDLLLKRRAHQRRKSLKPLSHVAGLHRHEHPRASRKTQHPRPNPIARRTSARQRRLTDIGHQQAKPASHFHHDALKFATLTLHSRFQPSRMIHLLSLGRPLLALPGYLASLLQPIRDPGTCGFR